MQKALNTDLTKPRSPKGGQRRLLRAGEMDARTKAGEPKLREADVHTEDLLQEWKSSVSLPQMHPHSPCPWDASMVQVAGKKEGASPLLEGF